MTPYRKGLQGVLERVELMDALVGRYEPVLRPALEHPVMLSNNRSVLGHRRLDAEPSSATAV